MLVILISASELDRPVAEKIIAELSKYSIPYQEHVLSAHKVPEKVYKLIIENNHSDKKICYITIVGRSNGLSGVVAANSIHPVIACPNFTDKTDYLVNIHSTLQMPSDTPVLAVIQPENAAMAAARILGLSERSLQGKIKKRIEEIKTAY